MDITKAIELLRIYTLEHGTDMDPDDLEAHIISIETLNTFCGIQNQLALIRHELEKAGGLVSVQD